MAIAPITVRWSDIKKKASIAFIFSTKIPRLKQPDDVKAYNFKDGSKKIFCSGIGNHIMWPSCECQDFQMEKRSYHREILHANLQELIPLSFLPLRLITTYYITHTLGPVKAVSFFTPKKNIFCHLRFPVSFFNSLVSSIRSGVPI